MSGVSIADLMRQCKLRLEDWLSAWSTLVIVLLVAIISFGLGRLSVGESTKGTLTVLQMQSTSTVRAIPSGGEYIAARTGHSYYFPWCAGATRIAEQNRITFASEKAARDAGYAPAKNCKGLTNE